MADLLSQWAGAHQVGNDWMPRLVTMGIGLQNDAAKLQQAQQELNAKYLQMMAEQARASKQDEFQNRKFLYAQTQDAMDRARQAKLDATAQANWTVSNDRAGKMADAQISNWKDDNARQQQRADREAADNAPSNFDWMTGKPTTPAATTAPVTPPALTPLAPEPSPTIGPDTTANTSGGSSLPELPSWNPADRQGVSNQLLAPPPSEPQPPAPPAPSALNYSGQIGPPIGEPTPVGYNPAAVPSGPVAGNPYAGVFGASQAPAAPMVQSELQGHPGEAKWKQIMASPASQLSQGLIAGMKPAERGPALAAMAQINAMKNDPDVIDYQRQLAERAAENEWKRTEAMKDRGVDRQFQGEENEAARQIKAIERYAGSDILDNPQSPTMKNLLRGTPARDWRTAVADEEKTKADLQGQEGWTRNDKTVKKSMEDWKTQRDPSIEGQVKRMNKRAESNNQLPDKQWTDIKNKWASENPFAMRTIMEAATAAKSGGQAPTQEEMLQRLETAAKEAKATRDPSAMSIISPIPISKDWTESRSQFYNPDPEKRKRNWVFSSVAEGANGEPLSNKEIALSVYNDMMKGSDSTGLPKPSTPEEAWKLPIGTRYIGRDGSIKTRKAEDKP